MKIRKATKKDLKKISNIFRKESAKKPYNEKRTQKKALERVTEYFQRKEIYIVIIDKEIIGFIILSIDPDDKKKSHIGELWLKSDYQGKGIGKALIKFIEKTYKKKGVKIMQLAAMRKAGAFKFYKKLGYKEHDNLVLMEKKLR